MKTWPCPKASRAKLSRCKEILRYVKCLRNETKIASVSEVLKTLIQESRRYRELARLDAKITAYYSSLSEHEQEQEAEWDKFSEAEFFKVVNNVRSNA